MQMKKVLLDETQYTTDYFDFPLVIDRPVLLDLTFDTKPSKGDSRAEIMIYEYANGKALRRRKIDFSWSYGYSRAIDFRNKGDFHEDKKYMILISYKNNNNERIKNVIYIRT